MNHLLKKLLQTNIKKFYLIVSAVGIVVGLSLTTICVDVYHKILSTVMNGSGDQSYMIVNKKMSQFEAIFGDNDFHKEEIEDLKSQPFIEDVGVVSTSSCRIWAFRDKPPAFKTDMFFESLENKFLDKVPLDWHWRESSNFVPVMVNTDFLNLYNFAFAKSQGLPQFTKSTISQFVVYLEIKGNGKKERFKARIVDVSDRIPSIIVPKKFLDHINKNYGKPDNDKYSRVILKVKNPSDPALKAYFKKHKISANEDLLSSGKSKILLSAGLGSYALLAGIILLLAIIIVVLTFELIISSSQKDIQLLLQLGIHSNNLRLFLRKKLLVLLGIQLSIVSILVLFAAYFSSNHLTEIGYSNVPFISKYAIASFFFSVLGYFVFFDWRISRALKRN